MTATMFNAPTRILFFSLLLLCIGASNLQAADKTEAELAQVQQEKVKLDALRKQLESKLGTLGKELRTLDTALVSARNARREIDAKIAVTDRNLGELRLQKKQLKTEILRMEATMLEQSVAAYQRASHQPGWMDIFVGVSLAEIPHRKQMLQFAMLSQEQDRLLWQEKVAKLAGVEQLEVVKREELTVLKQEKLKHEREIAARLEEKRNMAKLVRQDVTLNKQRSKQLTEQEKALQRLLEGMSADLLGSDKAAKPQSVRKQRGRLPWPLKGKIMANFDSVPVAGRPKLTGVQIAPSSKQEKGRQVRAIAGGQVRYADWFGGYGLMMIVDHGDGLISVYAHNDALFWQMGDWVEAGEALAQAGSTGWIEDTRLYFEVRDKGKAVNPKQWCGR